MSPNPEPEAPSLGRRSLMLVLAAVVAALAAALILGSPMETSSEVEPGSSFRGTCLGISGLVSGSGQVLKAGFLIRREDGSRVTVLYRADQTALDGFYFRAVRSGSSWSRRRGFELVPPEGPVEVKVSADRDRHAESIVLSQP